MAKSDVRKQRWMAAAEDAILAERPMLSGKLDWDTLAYYFYDGQHPADAARKYIALVDADGAA